MPKTSERTNWLGDFARAPTDTPQGRAEFERGSRAIADPRYGPQLREAFHRYVTTVMAQQEGGAGLLADVQLRYFQRDYHYRLINKGGQYMPTNYRIAEAFFESRNGAPGFYLLPERDYQFSFTDFLDYVTGVDAPRAQLELGFGFLDGHVYNLTSSDPLGALLLETQGQGAYAMRAANIVRRGDELVVMLTLGEQLTVDRLDDILRPTDMAAGLNPAKPALATELSQAAQQPAYIEGTSLLATTALVRFNLRERRMESRCLLRDMTETFRTWTDDAMALGLQMTRDLPQFQRMVQELDDCDAVWEVAKTLTLLPAYLAAKVAWTRQRQERTQLGQALTSSLKKRRELKDARQTDKVLFRTISAIAVQPRDVALRLEGRGYTAPLFQVAVEGFWRVLRTPDGKGRGPAAEEVLGRTWVRSHIRHKDKALPAVQKVVYIKASLSEARARLERYRRQAEKSGAAAMPSRLEVELPASTDEAHLRLSPAEASLGEEAGRPGAFVYIMRCHAHVENLFKVGFTDRDPETRAKELSAVTAAPLPFQVLHAWAVSDGHAAEQDAHAALSRVRLSENREFFQLAYEELRGCVDVALAPWVLRA